MHGLHAVSASYFKTILHRFEGSGTLHQMKESLAVRQLQACNTSVQAFSEQLVSAAGRPLHLQLPAPNATLPH